MTDDERLAKVITDSLQQVEKYFDDDDVPMEKAFRALDSADGAVKELSEKLRELRGRLNDIIAPDVWPWQFDDEEREHGGMHVVRAKPSEGRKGSIRRCLVAPPKNLA